MTGCTLHSLDLYFALFKHISVHRSQDVSHRHAHDSKKLYVGLKESSNELKSFFRRLVKFLVFF